MTGYEAGLIFPLARSVQIVRQTGKMPRMITGESEAKAPETADQPVESAARRQPGTKYEAVAQASQVAHQLTPAEAKAIRLELDFPDLDRIARSGGHGPALASALRKIDAICNWPDCCLDDDERFAQA